MSKLPEAVIDAARADCDITGEREIRARRVINALAENLPESAVEEASFVICRSGKFECGLGRCAPICAGTMGHRPKRCSYAKDVHGPLARAIVTWNVHPFIAGFWAAILCWAIIENITKRESEGEKDGAE